MKYEIRSIYGIVEIFSCEKNKTMNSVLDLFAQSKGYKNYRDGYSVLGALYAKEQAINRKMKTIWNENTKH